RGAAAGVVSARIAARGGRSHQSSEGRAARDSPGSSRQGNHAGAAGTVTHRPNREHRKRDLDQSTPRRRHARGKLAFENAVVVQERTGNARCRSTESPAHGGARETRKAGNSRARRSTIARTGRTPA